MAGFLSFVLDVVSLYSVLGLCAFMYVVFRGDSERLLSLLVFFVCVKWFACCFCVFSVGFMYFMVLFLQGFKDNIIVEC